MPDLHLFSRAALADRTPLETADISLRPLSELHVIHVLAKSSADGRTMPGQLRAIRHSVRPVSPGQWFIVTDTALSPTALKEMFESLAPDAAGVDQSHGRVRIAISGPMVERTLAKGTGVDLAISAFPVGHATTTLIGHIAAHLTRLEEKSFEVIVLRGFAESLWDDLVRMSI